MGNTIFVTHSFDDDIYRYKTNQFVKGLYENTPRDKEHVHFKDYIDLEEGEFIRIRNKNYRIMSPNSFHKFHSWYTIQEDQRNSLGFILKS